MPLWNIATFCSVNSWLALLCRALVISVSLGIQWFTSARSAENWVALMMRGSSYSIRLGLA